MKVFQILDRFCHWDATNMAATAADAAKRYPGLEFVEAPDFVFEGWGYAVNREGDERFIRPTPPEGYSYDEETGTMYETGTVKPAAVMSQAELTAAVLALFESLL